MEPFVLTFMSWTEYVNPSARVVPRFVLLQEQQDKKSVAALVLQEGAEVDQEECSECSQNVSES